jgi:hypothetical protein
MTDASQREAKQRELQELRERVASLEKELAETPRWQATEYYASYYATTGFMLGILAAGASLLFNVVGSVLFDKRPLELIRVYLTFPLGEQALSPEMDSGIVLAIGCCLYLATGMLLGIPFNLFLTRFTGNSSFGVRFLWASVLGIAIWLFNFYVILSWLQPLLFGGRWIVDTIPWWVAMLTHLVFGWTMAVIYPLGLYTPYRNVTEQT